MLALKRLQNTTVIALFMCMVLAFGLAVFSATKNQQNYRPDRAGAYETNGETTRVSTEERLAEYTLALAILTGVLAASTIGLWLVNYFTLRHSRETAERELRAYVLAKDGKVFDFGSFLVIEAQVRIQNYGQTPAHDVMTWVGVTLDNWPAPKTLARPPKTLEQSKAILGPKDRSIISAKMGRPLTPIELQKIRSGAAAIYLFGEIIYCDAFGNSQTTEFRFAYGGPAGENSKGKVGACMDGNRAT